ncbi:precorrin-4 C(11)-methyltransferase [Clostridiaceae bacterium]|nr:precorrin-4 C(11)-methyltransferase [Clostridium sp.]NBI71960.1 precorrin-4 C(11)-methyltransferase [Clostridiaceae bacterium]
MVYFVGAGSGAADLITVRGARLLEEADQIIYAGSLVNPELLKDKKPGCVIRDSAVMTLEEVMEQVLAVEGRGGMTVRLHTGDPSIYGAVREQMDRLEELGIPFEVCPGVSSLSGAAAALNLEYTLPGVSQSLIITRMAGRTPVPERESIASFAAHGASMAIFLSAGMTDRLEKELLRGGYEADTPAAIVYKATWPDEKKAVCTIGTLAETARREGIHKTALIVVGEAVAHSAYERSKLYDPLFTTGFRTGRDVDEDPSD